MPGDGKLLAKEMTFDDSLTNYIFFHCLNQVNHGSFAIEGDLLDRYQFLGLENESRPSIGARLG